MKSIGGESNREFSQLSGQERKEVERRKEMLSGIERKTDIAIENAREAGRQTRNNIHRLANSPYREPRQDRQQYSKPTESNHKWITWLIALAAVVAIVGIISNSVKKNNNDTNSWIGSISTPSQEKISQQVQQQERDGPFTNGSVFPDSSTRYLTEDEILSLQDCYGYSRAELIQYAINELYARNHFSFKKEKTIAFYKNFTWYVDYGYDYNDDELMKQLFNDYEEYNLQLLAKVRKLISD